MKIKHNIAIQDDGVTIKGQVLDTIFEKGDCIGKTNLYTEDGKFRIASILNPELKDGVLYVHGTGGDNERIVSYTYSSKLLAQDAMEYINSFTDFGHQFMRGELVEVSNNEIDWYKRIYLTTIEGAVLPYRCVSRFHEYEFQKGERFDTCGWKRIRKIQQPETITITTKDGQEVTITKEKALELGFEIK